MVIPPYIEFLLSWVKDGTDADDHAGLSPTTFLVLSHIREVLNYIDTFNVPLPLDPGLASAIEWLTNPPSNDPKRTWPEEVHRWIATVTQSEKTKTHAP